MIYNGEPGLLAINCFETTIGQENVLIPIDFRVVSLNALRIALERIDEFNVNVTLLYCQTLNDSITELLFYSPTKIISELQTNDFRGRVCILRNRFENKIGTVEIKLFHGYVRSVFDRLLDTLQIDGIYTLKSYQLHLAQRAFDPIPYIKKSSLPHYELTWDQQYEMPQEDKLENLFW